MTDQCPSLSLEARAYRYCVRARGSADDCLAVGASVAAIHHCGLATLEESVPEVIRRRYGLESQSNAAEVDVSLWELHELREAAPVRRTGSPAAATSAASCDSAVSL